MPLTSGTPRWQKIATFGLLLAIFLTVLFIYQRAGQTNAAVSATKDSAARLDCARQVNAEQSTARDAASLADRAVSRYYYKAALNSAVTGQRADMAQLDEFAGLVKTADNADATVAELPDPAKEVDRRCPG